MPDFTLVPTGFVLELEDGVDKVAFVDSGTTSYRLLDGTFVVSPPRAIDVSYDANQLGRKIYSSRSYESREIRFSFRCSGTTYDDVVQKMNRVAAMLERAQSGVALSGGFFSGKIGYTGSYTDSPYSRSAQTGDQGLVLRVRLGDQDSTTPVYTTENGTTIAKTDIVTYTVHFGDWEWPDAFSMAGIQRKESALYVLDNIGLLLTCEPYATGDSRVVYGPLAGGFVAMPYPVGGVTNTRNKTTISAASIPGSAPALTRVSMRNDGGAGVVISRDGPFSIWNAPSAPILTRTNGLVKQVITTGYSTDVGKKIEVQLTQLNPVIFKTRINGGSWTSTTTPTANTKYYVGLGTGENDIAIIFTTTNFATYQLNDIIAFASHQAPIATANATYNLYSNAATLIGINGASVCSFHVSIPPKTSNKYKILMPMWLSGASVENIIEARIGLYYNTPGGVTTISYTNWMSWPTSNYWLADFGSLDLTPTGTPGRAHPGAYSVATAIVYVRTTSLVTAASTLNFDPVLLVACSDPSSYLIAKWAVDELSGYEVISNYDPDRPYMMEMSRSPASILTGDETSVSYDLDATYTGGYITLIPGMDNTVLTIGLFAAAGVRDYRACTWAGTLYDYCIAIRPRYLFAGS